MKRLYVIFLLFSYLNANTEKTFSSFVVNQKLLSKDNDFVSKKEIDKENKPVLSIITSVYKADKFINFFLENITQQTIFKQCELILINANSPCKDKEEDVILKYCSQYPNIVYMSLQQDPGLYGVWNLGIKISQADYLTNANVDDAVEAHYYELCTTALDKDQSVDLVYADYYQTPIPNLNIEKIQSMQKISLPEFEEFSKKSVAIGNHPVWRKSCHEKCGYFDTTYKIGGDYDMWLRFLVNGSIFKKIYGTYGTFYINPEGLSTASKNSKCLNEEIKRIINTYYPILFPSNKLP